CGGRVDRIWHFLLNLEGHTPVLPLSGDGDVFHCAINGATVPELDPADQRQIDPTSIQFEALRIPEAVRQKFLAITRWCCTTSEEIGIGAFQILQALLKDLGMHASEPAVFLALFPPGEQRTRLSIGETRHACEVAVLIDRQHLIPDK